MLLIADGLKPTQTTGFVMVNNDFLREHHWSLTVIILPSSSNRADALTDAQFSPVGRLRNARKREGEPSRIRKGYAHLSTAAFSNTLMFVSVADCTELSQGWPQQARQIPKTHMTLFDWHVLGAKLRGYRALVSILIRRICSFTNLLNPSRMQAVDGVSEASRSVKWAPIIAGRDKIDASRFRSGNTMRGCGLYGFLSFKHLSKVVGLLSSSRLVTCTWIYYVAIVAFASHGPVQ